MDEGENYSLVRSASLAEKGRHVYDASAISLIISI